MTNKLLTKISFMTNQTENCSYFFRWAGQLTPSSGSTEQHVAKVNLSSKRVVYHRPSVFLTLQKINLVTIKSVVFLVKRENLREESKESIEGLSL